jgi:peptidoglycan/xylan/chitin deacetylase (PgdA/CDA1 family)
MMRLPTGDARGLEDHTLKTGLRARAVPAVKSALLRLGAYAALRRLPSPTVAILRYHAVCGEEGHRYASPGICISPAAFERHVRYLASNYAVLPLPEVVERLRTSRALPRNAVAITFDDGYADNLAAARTLARHGLTATFYLTAGCLADGAPFWPAELRMLLPAVRGATLRLRVDGRSIEVPLAGTGDLEGATRIVTKLFKSQPIPVRESLRDQLRAAAQRPGMPRVMLTWDEVAEMRRLGMTIGSHTMTHPNLPSAGPAAATQEIVESKARLEHETGERVTMFSYPNGGAERYETPELRRVVAGAGFSGATTSRNGFARAASDLYALERVQVHERLEDLVFALEVERFVLQPRPRAGETAAALGESSR